MKSPPVSSCRGVSAFRRWMRSQDAGRLLASLRARPLAGFLLRGSALVGVVAWAPGVHALFAVPATPALA
ncbi:sensor histidine kinase, partial [Corallococcus sp. 4LFB]